MQRVRIGLTGLGFVFLAVLLAAIFTSQTRDEPPVNANLLEPPPAGSGPAPQEKQAEPTEPLATLGVAPGNVDSNESAGNDATPAPVPAPRQ